MMLNTRTGMSDFIYKLTSYVVVSAVALLCLLPVILVFSASFSSEEAIYEFGYRLFPKNFSLEAYRIVFESPQALLGAYGITLIVTGLGTLLGLLITSLLAYVIWRSDFPYRNHLAFFIYFTSIFSGGLVPLYIWIVRYLEIKDTLWALILPNLTNAWNILIFRSFLNATPASLVEAAKIDGAGDFTIYRRVILPVAIPGLAVVGMFQALYYWNDWYLAKLYIDSEHLYPLQFFLYRILNNLQAMQEAIASAGIPIPDMPSQSLKMAMTMLVATPVFFLFPFVQRFLVKGITVGSVKG